MVATSKDRLVLDVEDSDSIVKLQRCKLAQREQTARTANSSCEAHREKL